MKWFNDLSYEFQTGCFILFFGATVSVLTFSGVCIKQVLDHYYPPVVNEKNK